MTYKYKRLKIAYVSSDDVLAQTSYQAGTRYYIGKYLEKHLGDVDFICPLESKEHYFLQNIKRRIYKYIYNKKYLPDRSSSVLRYSAEQILYKIRHKYYDIIFSPDSRLVSHLETSIPIVFYSDAIFDSMVDFYAEFTNLCDESIRDGHNQEQEAMNRAMLTIYSSQWAVDAAIRGFDVRPDKVKFILFGANLPTIPKKENILKPKNMDVCNLLFVGADWERKGGPSAVKVVEALNKRGLKSRLYVCSRLPKSELLNEFVENVGLLDRNKAHENKKIEELFICSHFLFLPTKADCTPMVFSEAAAFGLPVITTNVGGNSSVVENGKNGIILDKDTDIEEYADIISEIFTNTKKYRELSECSRKMFEEELNWDASITKVSSLIRESLGFS